MERLQRIEVIFFSSRTINRAWIKIRRLETIQQVTPDAKDKIMSGLLVQYDVIMHVIPLFQKHSMNELCQFHMLITLHSYQNKTTDLFERLSFVFVISARNSRRAEIPPRSC